MMVFNGIWWYKYMMVYDDLWRYMMVYYYIIYSIYIWYITQNYIHTTYYVCVLSEKMCPQFLQWPFWVATIFRTRASAVGGFLAFQRPWLEWRKNRPIGQWKLQSVSAFPGLQVWMWVENLRVGQILDFTRNRARIYIHIYIYNIYIYIHTHRIIGLDYIDQQKIQDPHPQRFWSFWSDPQPVFTEWHDWQLQTMWQVTYSTGSSHRFGTVVFLQRNCHLNMKW